MPRRGYMLDVAVEGAPAPSSPDPPAEAIPARTVPWRRTALAGAAAAALAAGAALMLLDGANRDMAGPRAPPPETAVSGRDEARRLHAEGRSIAYGPGVGVPEWLRARPLFEQAMQADPSWLAPYAETVFTYTNVVLAGGSLNPEADLRQAEAIAARAVALGPGSAEALNARAAVRRHQGRHEEALADYRAVTALRPNILFPRANAGWMLVLLGRPEEGAGLLRGVLAEDPEHNFARGWHAYLGLAEMFAGLSGRGLEHLRQGRESRVFPDPEAITLYIAAALALSGDVGPAEAVIGELRLRRPDLTLDRVRANPLSREPGFQPHQAALLAALERAGLR